MSFRNFVSFHVHPGSFDSASTPAAMAEREKELGTGILTATDHGTLSTCPQVYQIAKKHGLKAALGLEGYFRDDNDPILKQHGIDLKPESEKEGAKISTSWYGKYYHVTLLSLDQEAYETMGRVLSRADLHNSETHGSEHKPLFVWSDLEEILAKNVMVGTGCLVGMVQRHLLNGRPDLATAYYERLRGIAKPGNMYVEVFPHRCDKNWVDGVFVDILGADPLRFYDGKNLRVKIGQEVLEIKAKKLVDSWEKLVLKAKGNATVLLLGQKDYSKWVEYEKPLTVTGARYVQDYVLNECTDFAQDGAVQTAANKFMIELAQKHGDTVVVSDDAHFAHADEKVVQDVRLLANGGSSWRMSESYHRRTSEEAFAHFKQYMGTSEKQFEGWVQNSHDMASRFGWEWKPRRELPTKFFSENTTAYTAQIIKEVGRMRWNDPVYVQRLKDEIKMLRDNGVIDLLPYFFVDQGVVDYYEKHGQLTGVGRGSAGGLLLAYLLGITHLDPIRYRLSKERFLTPTRIKSGKWPDIDQDLQSRDLLVDPKDQGKGYLYEKYADHFAQISNDNSLRIKSSIKDVHRVRHGKVTPEIEILCKKIWTPPQGVSDKDFVFGYKGADGEDNEGSINADPALMEYVKTYPEEWKIVQKAMGLRRDKGRHACAFVISNEPISGFLPLTTVGDTDVPVTQYTKDHVEWAGGLKVDFLVVDVLADIQGAIQLIQKRCNYTPKDELINGVRVPGLRVVPKIRNDGGYDLYDVWDFPEDQDVFDDICAGRTETVFQFNTPSAKQWLGLFNKNGHGTLTSVKHLSDFTALDRPGPLDSYVQDGGVSRNMLEEYAARSKGETPIGNIPTFDKALPDTYGIMVYQEQLTKMFAEIGQTTAEQADEFRVHVSKKKAADIAKDRELFVRGATVSLGSAEKAEEYWQLFSSWAEYGFNMSHSVAYALTGYACAYLKHHYPTEWWCSVLRNANRKKIKEKHWRYCSHLVLPPDIQHSSDNFVVEGDKIRAPLRLLEGVGETAHAELVEIAPFASIREFCQKIFDRRVKNGTQTTKIKETKKHGKQEVVVTKLGRSNINNTLTTKLISSGTMDSLFPADVNTVYAKLDYYAQVKAEVEGKKKKAVDDAFKSLSALQIYQIKKQVLPSYSEDLRTYFPDKFKQGKRMPAWEMPRAFDGNEWCPIVDGTLAAVLLDKENPRNDITPKFKFGVVAYVISAEGFWQNKAYRVNFEVDGEQFELVRWPSWDEKKQNKGAQLPDKFVGSISILTISRWGIEKEWQIDDIKVLQEKLDLKPNEEESKE